MTDRASQTDRLLENNATYADGFGHAGLSAPPGLHVAVVTCMDARVNPYGLLGLTEGDAHVIRNAGAVVTDDAIRSLTISQRLLGTREILVIAHTDCGMLSFQGDDLRAQIEADTGQRPTFSMETFRDLDQEVRQSLARIRNSPFIPHKESVRGFVYDVETGRLREVG